MVRIKHQSHSAKPSKPSQQAQPPVSPVRRAGQLLRQRGRVVTVLLVVALLGWGTNRVWQKFAPQISQRDNYRLAYERITTTPLPEWIVGDVRGEAIRNAGLAGRLSILDDAFAQVIEDAFILHPWVESVDQITKVYPAGVHVELSYRVPVAVVELVNQNVVQLVPIDQYGIHLPAEDVPNIRKRYLPRIGGIVERPPVGQAWVDLRVLGAAEIAVRLAPYWESLHLVDILPSARAEIRGKHRYFLFNLITRGGTKVVWGAAPSAAPPSEDTFVAKLERLKSCAENYGPLDSVRGPAVVDVRKGRLAITPRTVKKLEGQQAVK